MAQWVQYIIFRRRKKIQASNCTFLRHGGELRSSWMREKRATALPTRTWWTLTRGSSTSRTRSLSKTNEAGQDTTGQSGKPIEATSGTSVSCITNNFMRQVRVGSNEVFSYVAKQTMTSGNKGASNRVAGIGLPCEYKMIRAARRNWLTVVALSGFGPLSRKVLTATAGLNYGHLIVEGDSRHLPVQKFQIWWLIGVQ